MPVTAGTASPGIRRHLLRDEGEVVVDEVRKHPVAYLRAGLEGSAALLLLGTVPLWRVDLGWLPMLLAAGIGLHGFWLVLGVRADVFVITNMRVFRVHGVLTRHLATMPLTRILDITVDKPMLGRLLGYGHFIFESAAQAQGLRDIRYVGRPDERDLSIQRVVQRSGLRGPRVVN